MNLRLWPWRKSVEPAIEEPATEEPTPPPELHRAPEPDASARPESPGGQRLRAPAPAPAEEGPASVSLTLAEAKTAIRAAGGDVIQIGFLASAHRRHQEDDPKSAETAAAHQRLCELVGKRLKDRKLLAPEGTFELLEDPGAPQHLG